MDPDFCRLVFIAKRAEQILLDFSERFAPNHGAFTPAQMKTFSVMVESLTRLTSIRKTLIALDKATASTASTLSTASTSSISPDLATFLDLHSQAARLLGGWFGALALPMADSQFPAFFEAVGCLRRLVSIHKTAVLAPERIGPRDLEALHAVSGLIQKLTGITLAPLGARASSPAPLSPAATAPPSPDPNSQPTTPKSQPESPDSQPTTHNSQPEINPQSAFRNLQSLPGLPLRAFPPASSLHACYLLTAPGAALSGVYRKINGLPGFPPSPAAPSSTAPDFPPVPPAAPSSPPGSAGVLARSGAFVSAPAAGADEAVRAPRVISSFELSVLNFNLILDEAARAPRVISSFELSVLNFNLIPRPFFSPSARAPLSSSAPTPPAASLPLRWPWPAAA